MYSGSLALFLILKVNANEDAGMDDWISTISDGGRMGGDKHYHSDMMEPEPISMYPVISRLNNSHITKFTLISLI